MTLREKELMKVKKYVFVRPRKKKDRKKARAVEGLLNWQIEQQMREIRERFKSYHWKSCDLKKYGRCTCGLDEVLGLEPME